MIIGTSCDDAIEVTVIPGGGLHGLRLTERALRSGPTALADAVLAAVHVATVRANRAVRRAQGADLDALGIVDDPAVDPDDDQTTTTTLVTP